MASTNGTGAHGLHAPPVTKEILQQTASVLGVQVPGKWEEDFTVMLGSVREAMEKVLSTEGTFQGIICMLCILEGQFTLRFYHRARLGTLPAQRHLAPRL